MAPFTHRPTLVCCTTRFLKAAFTIKELRELTKLGPAAVLRVNKREFTLGETAASIEEVIRDS